MFSCFHLGRIFFVYCVVNCFNDKVRNIGLYNFQLLDEEHVLQSIKDDRDQEQEDKEIDTNNGNDKISFEIEMANLNNDGITKKKGSNQSEELSEVDIVDTCGK